MAKNTPSPLRKTPPHAMILGGGMAGLAVGLASGLPVYEAEAAPGGICSSYYVRPGSRERLHQPPDGGEFYRFEPGGGHWIFGGDSGVVHFICRLTPVKYYKRRSSVYLPDQNLYVPYPLQNNLRYLPEAIRVKALKEILTASQGNPRTMAEWLCQTFGSTLTETFFGPFHELYTAGLWKHVAPQDGYKSPIDRELVIRGTSEATPPAGYNVTFIYPEQGLNTLAERMADHCDIHYGKQVVWIDLERKQLSFADGSLVGYNRLVSTLPLNKMLDLTGLKLEEEPDPYTSVLVLNIGAKRGPCCPEDHWIYVPRSKAGFHRVGFYSNVDSSFLPKFSQLRDRVSIYVEKAYPGGERPSPVELASCSEATVNELCEWGFISGAEVLDPTWVDVAYTWSWPGSRWRRVVLKAFEARDITMVGRYGCWAFQGIADSIRDGLLVGASPRAGFAWAGRGSRCRSGPFVGQTDPVSAAGVDRSLRDRRKKPPRFFGPQRAGASE